MKNVFMGVLCVLLTACFIWGCSLSAEEGGLIREKAELTRKYRVLQTLYNQARTEAESREESLGAERKTWREKEQRLEAALHQAQAETEAARQAAEEARAAAAVTEEAREESGIFAGPAPEETQHTPAPETPEDEAPADAEAEKEDGGGPLD